MKSSKQKVSFILMLSFLFIIQLTLTAADKKITILHTNDIHGNFLPITIKPKKEGQTERQLGGFLALENYVTGLREKDDNVLLFDAGDFMTGNPITDIEVEGAKGGAMIDFFNQLGYDGQTLGNHEFDISLNNVRNLVKLAKYPVFSANLFTTDGNLFAEAPYHIYEKDGMKIGVIGVIVNDLPDYINAPQKNQLKVKPAAFVIDSLAQVLDPETDLIVVLSHSGLDMDKDTALQLSERVDVIIGGHSHTRMKKAETVNGILIVQAGSSLANVGHLELTVENDRIEKYDYKLVPLWNKGIVSNPELAKKVKYYDDEITKEYGRVIGHLEKSWYRSHNYESNIGNFIADVIREYAEVDVAGLNSGGIRKNLEAGPIKKLDIKNILPFANTIVKFNISGEDLLNFIKLNAKASAYKTHGVVQISGLKYTYEKAGDDKIKILEAKVGPRPIVPDKFYSFATLNFVATNWEKYLGFEPKDMLDTMTPLSELVMNTIEKQKNINSKVEARMLKK